MAQLQSLASAFNPGHDLWIVPDLSSSRWTLRLDWYLNFQIIRANRHPSPELPKEVDEILERIEWKPEALKTATDATLMISCDHLLPARWVAVVPNSGDLSDWTKRIEALWRNLRQPTLKVFLPTGLQAGSFSEEWRRQSDQEDYSLVLDQDPLLQ